MLRHFFVGGVICLGLFATAEADAQLVRIGPLGGVSIRVPFVSVDVDPWGGTRVRAPFTAVDAPGHYHHHSYYDHHGHHYGIPLYDLPRYGYSLPYDAYSQPYQPYSLPYRPYTDPASDYDPYAYDPYAALPRRPYQSRDLADLDADAIELPYSPYDADWLRSREAELGSASSADRVAAASSGYAAAGADSALRHSLADAARRLDAALQQRSDGQVWQDYLQPLRIADVADSKAASTTGADADQLRELLDNFDGVTANNSLGWVTRLDGFDATHRLLRQWALVGSPIPADSATSDDSGMELSEPASDAPGQRPPLEAEELPPPAPQPETPTRYEA